MMTTTRVFRSKLVSEFAGFSLETKRAIDDAAHAWMSRDSEAFRTEASRMVELLPPGSYTLRCFYRAMAVARVDFAAAATRLSTFFQAFPLPHHRQVGGDIAAPLTVVLHLMLSILIKSANHIHHLCSHHVERTLHRYLNTREGKEVLINVMDKNIQRETARSVFETHRENIMRWLDIEIARINDGSTCPTMKTLITDPTWTQLSLPLEDSVQKDLSILMNAPSEFAQKVMNLTQQETGSTSSNVRTLTISLYVMSMALDAKDPPRKTRRFMETIRNIWNLPFAPARSAKFGPVASQCEKAQEKYHAVLSRHKASTTCDDAALLKSYNQLSKGSQKAVDKARAAMMTLAIAENATPRQCVAFWRAMQSMVTTLHRNKADSAVFQSAILPCLLSRTNQGLDLVFDLKDKKTVTTQK